MPRVGFEPTITASERAKTVHALDRSGTVTGYFLDLIILIILGEEYKLRTFSVCNCFHLPVTLSALGSNSFLCILFSQIQIAC
jgi:hypothetical protein